MKQQSKASGFIKSSQRKNQIIFQTVQAQLRGL